MFFHKIALFDQETKVTTFKRGKARTQCLMSSTLFMFQKYTAFEISSFPSLPRTTPQTVNLEFSRITPWHFTKIKLSFKNGYLRGFLYLGRRKGLVYLVKILSKSAKRFLTLKGTKGHSFIAVACSLLHTPFYLRNFRTLQLLYLQNSIYLNEDSVSAWLTGLLSIELMKLSR